ncbi:hypothetical protein PIB30_001062 [Stylosanthes scabra]|uniref:Uncharacterized protein n=1 Tax=Stylosanthes scabra TaxID=79078 RepID=A0ABU6U197_9FABA|nr:hypothetical protein [Stylosanthes scabra]
MPIYHDYHGDSRSSSISTWDQIQISLKCLLPSYEPILCDSSVVSSFLNYQKQPLSFPEFQQSSVTIHNRVDEDESDVSSNYQGVFDWSTTVVVQRPPPEPPDLGAFEVSKDEAALGERTSRRPDNMMKTVTVIPSGTEDGAVAKGKDQS